MKFTLLFKVSALCQNVVDSSSDGVIKLNNVFTTAVLNILWVMVSSRRFERGDPKMDELATCMHGFMRFSNGGPTWLSLIPILRFIIPELSGYNKLMGYIRPIRSYVEVITLAIIRLCFF